MCKYNAQCSFSLPFSYSSSLSLSLSISLKYPGAKCTWKQRKEQIRKTQNEPQWRDVKVRCIKEGVPSYPYSNFSDMSRWRCDSIMFVLTFFLLFFHSLLFDLSLNSEIPWCKVHLKREERTNQKNSGWTSVDRSTKATLSTYNTWIQLSRLQKIYHFQSLKLRLATEAFNGNRSSYATGPRPNGCHVTMEAVDNTA